MDLERIEPSENHNQRHDDNLRELQSLRDFLVQAEQAGRWSKAKKIRRAINQHLEVDLYIRHSWCGGCHNVLHNCKCKAS